MKVFLLWDNGFEPSVWAVALTKARAEAEAARMYRDVDRKRKGHWSDYYTVEEMEVLE